MTVKVLKALKTRVLMGVAEARPRLAHLITGLYIQAHIHPLSQQVRLSPAYLQNLCLSLC